MDKVKVGFTVDIARTDGRVHSSRISCLNVINRTVTVEWMENQETKAKEVEIESILTLNPHLLLTHPATEAQPTTVVRASTRSALQNRSSILRSNAVINPGLPNLLEPPKNNPVIGVVSPERRVSSPAPPISSSGTQRMSTRNRPSVHGAPVTKSVTKRRTTALKEVGRLEKNREDRRIRLTEDRDEKRALLKKGAGNPNWEFSAMINEFRSTLDFRPIRDSDNLSDCQISVCVRKRPINKKEFDSKEIDIVTIPNKQRIIVHEPKLKVDLTKYLENQNFCFDFAFDENCDNEKVYDHTARPLVQTIFDGGMATCFAYGQTGSGKTHTMGGEFQGKNQNCGNGIYVLTAIDVFQRVSRPQYRDLQLVVSASFFEIYSGKVFDLLNGKSKLRVLEDGKQQVQVVGLSERPVDSVDQVLDVIRLGSRARTSGQTSANANSSRSHAVFQIVLRCRSNNRLHGKFSLVDLAGNERGADTNSADRQTRMEGAEINKSLLALKECIRALGRKGAHLPFRASKLTQVLKDSFVGDKAKTCMIAMISPGMSSCEHSLNTLRYADRVKELSITDSAVVESAEKEPSFYVSPKHSTSSPHLQSNSIMSPEDILSAKLYSFHEDGFRLQEMEEDVIESHKMLLKTLPKWQQSIDALVATTDHIDFDVEVYIQQMGDVIEEVADNIFRLKSKLSEFSKEVEEDEQNHAIRLMRKKQPLGFPTKNNKIN